MSEITELCLRDVRCFEGRQSAHLGRITLLVGENSTGKSTFLGCYKVFAKLSNFIGLQDKNYFDEEPFRMGNFDTVARSGNENFFVGGAFKDHCHTGVEFTFTENDRGLPAEQRIRLKFEEGYGKQITLDISCPLESPRLWRFEGPDFRFDLDRSEVSYVQFSTWLSNYVRNGFLPFFGESSSFRKREGRDATIERQIEFGKFVNFLRARLPLPEESAFIVETLDPAAPPRVRVYDTSPLGDEDDVGLKKYLMEAGKNLGLFSGIDVRYRTVDRLFELLVERSGKQYNIVDVGYGVHSILPLLRAIYGKPKGTVFLLQQPEVHLHPVAQAQLAQLMAESSYRFIIETHSDHLIDRLRICTMRKDIKPKDLSIVYFEPTDGGAKSRIYSISVDDNGNLVNEPEGYRRFFLDETEKLLGFF